MTFRLSVNSLSICGPPGYNIMLSGHDRAGSRRRYASTAAADKAHGQDAKLIVMSRLIIPIFEFRRGD